jgi:hypothetical protein
VRVVFARDGPVAREIVRIAVAREADGELLPVELSLARLRLNALVGEEDASTDGEVVLDVEITAETAGRPDLVGSRDLVLRARGESDSEHCGERREDRNRSHFGVPPVRERVPRLPPKAQGAST